jgi:plastocyanin
MSLKHFSKALTISLGAMVLAFSGAGLASAGKVTVIMKDKSYHISAGDQAGQSGKGFTLNVGEANEITLKNEDVMPHEFVSKALNSMDVAMMGSAEIVTDGKATGYRVDPGKTVILNVTPKVGDDFSGSYDVFYCSIHGKDTMKGEVIVADSRTGTGAF